MTEISAEELQRIIWNCLLFTDKKSPAGPVVQFTRAPHDPFLRVKATDGWMTFNESYFLGETREDLKQWYMCQEDLKELNKLLKEPGTQVQVDSLMRQEVTNPHPDYWEELRSVEQSVIVVNEAYPYAVSFDRWKLLARIRSGGDYPVAFRLAEYALDRSSFLEFKVGPHIRGLIAPLEYDSLPEEVKW